MKEKESFKSQRDREQQDRQASGGELGSSYGYFIVAAAFLIMEVIWAAFYAFGIFFKPILSEFGWTRAMTSGAFSLSSLMNGLLAIAMGGLTDRFGPRLVMTLCGLFLGLGYFLMSQISALWQLYLSYGVIVGIGMGGSFVPLMSTVARWFDEKRGLMFFSLGFCVFAIMVHLAPHATELDISAASAANILATVGGLSIVGKVVMGRVADMIGNRRTFIIGFVLMSAALCWLVPARMAWILYWIAGVFGFAYGACVASQSPLVAVLFGLGAHGLILGVLSFSFTLGGAVGPLLTGHLFDVTGSYRMAFTVCAATSSVGLILSVVLRRRSVTG